MKRRSMTKDIKDRTEQVEKRLGIEAKMATKTLKIDNEMYLVGRQKP